ncbi:hypothetical protein A0H81_07641 [Grifola frondosa]|uniref:Uncharacterized protein n=1 Tax=Grifola frondosa TaxID=5627 RepID=A0A1C7M6T5_GRIFR|nr:hypothetical protein A0H81_07641 [Grifola frondosa]
MYFPAHLDIFLGISELLFDEVDVLLGTLFLFIEGAHVCGQRIEEDTQLLSPSAGGVGCN